MDENERGDMLFTIGELYLQQRQLLVLQSKLMGELTERDRIISELTAELEISKSKTRKGRGK